MAKIIKIENMKKALVLFTLVVGTLRIFAQHSTGENGNQTLYKTIQAGYTPGVNAPLPRQHSLKKYAPIPGNQGDYGTCTAWAEAYCARTICESVAINRTNEKASKEAAFSPIFLYHLIKNQKDTVCKNGSNIHLGFKTLKTIGVPKFNTIKDDCASNISQSDYDLAFPYRIKEYYRLEDKDNDILTEIRTHLAQNHPVICALMVTPSFDRLRGIEEWQPTKAEIEAKKICNNSNESIIDNTLLIGGHALCIVGYNDDELGGCFEIQNSWGTNWGKDGYFKISYANFLVMYRKYSCSAMVPDDKIEPTYTHSGEVKILLTNYQSTQTDTISLFKKLLEDAKRNKRRTNNFFATTQTFKNGDKIKVLFNSSKASYVYAFLYDTTLKRSKQLFPYNNLNPYINFNDYYMDVPGGENYVQFGKQKGKKYLIVLLSPQTVDLEPLQNRENRADFNVFSQLQVIYKDRTVTGKEFESMGEFESKFSVTTKKQDYIIPLFIELIEK